MRNTRPFARTRETRQCFTAVISDAFYSTGANTAFAVAGARARAGTIKRMTCPSGTMRKRAFLPAAAPFGVDYVDAILTIALAH